MKKKINQKFYALTKDGLQNMLRLRPAEKDVLLYLRVIDPFGDGCEVTVSEIAEFLGRNKSTITRALNVLCREGFINLEMISFRVKITEAIAPHVTDVALPDEPIPEEPITDSSMHRAIPPRIEQFPHASNDSYTHRTIPTGISEEPEPKQYNDSESSKTYKNYLKLLETLSDNTQRERFLEFCEYKARQLPQPVRMIDKWIYKNFDFLKAQFMQETGEALQVKGSELEKTQVSPNGQFSAPRQPKIKKIALAPEVVEALEAAIADKKIKNYWYCEPLKRWMVLLNSGQMEVEFYLEREAMKRANS